MSWVAPRTWVTGEIVSAAIMNTHIRDNLLESAPAKAAAAGDMFVATGVNAIKRIALGAAKKFLKVNAGGTDVEWGIISEINDANGNEVAKFTGVASAVNEVTITNAGTGAKPTLEATGDDTNISMHLKGKGTGVVDVESNTQYATAQLRNVIQSTSTPGGGDGNNGDIWLKYNA
jgi:hypothetical protein